MTVENLKAENDQLKTGGPASRPPSSTSQSSGLGSLGVSSPRQSMSSFGKSGMGQNEPYPGHTFTHTDFMLKCGVFTSKRSWNPDFLTVVSVHLTDVFQSPTATLQKDESLVRVLVRIPNQHLFKDVSALHKHLHPDESADHVLYIIKRTFNWTSHILYRILLSYIFIIVFAIVIESFSYYYSIYYYLHFQFL